MKTQKIQSNVTFGYNPEVNAQLIAKLDSAKKNKAYCNFVKNICVATNTAERELRTAEIQNKKYLQSLLIATFVPMKILVTDMVHYLFPKLNYRQKELESYNAEVEANNLSEEAPSHWINTIAETLKAHEATDQTANFAYKLQQKMQKEFPGVKFDFSGLINSIGGNSDVEESDESEIIDEDLAEKLELGQTKAELYEPTLPEEKMGFASLGGMKELKDELYKIIINPLKNPEQAKLDEIEYGKKFPKGILLYGPPGCGKTTIVERLSVEAGVPLIEMSTDSFGSTLVDGEELNVGAVFKYAEMIATPEKPVILLLDDVDTILPSRESESNMVEYKKGTLGVLFKRIQNARKNNIIVVAATNKYDQIDPALKRRFDKQIFVPLPDKDARLSILKLKLGQMTKAETLLKDDFAMNKISENTERFDIGALNDIVDAAADIATEDGRRELKLSDFETVLARPEFINRKVKEDVYKANATRKMIGF